MIDECKGNIGGGGATGQHNSKRHELRAIRAHNFINIQHITDDEISGGLPGLLYDFNKHLIFDINQRTQ